MDLFPLYNSLRISFISSCLTLCLGIFIAWRVTKLSDFWKIIIDSVLTIPMVLPPTVVGFLLLVMISPKSFIGELVNYYFNSNLTMTWYVAVLAVMVVTFPIIYRTMRSSFEYLDKDLILAAQTLGLNNGTIFRKIIFPECKSGFFAGFVLSFARGLGEYGATSMVSGYIPQKTATISTTVAFYWQTGQEENAVFWVILNLCISLFVMFIVNRLEKDIR